MIFMARPVKPRKIGYIPSHKLFVPEDKKYCKQEEIILKHDELEAMRLKDVENLNQEECATIMDISRQTFQLIIDRARAKVTEALIEGKPLRIYGGNYVMRDCVKRCKKCGNIYGDIHKNGHCCRWKEK